MLLKGASVEEVREDYPFLKAEDVELAKLKESGEFAKIIAPYGFSAQAAMSTSRDKLCAAQ